MHKEYEIEEYTAIEEQIHYYCKCLLVVILINNKVFRKKVRKMQKHYNMHIYILTQLFYRYSN